MTRLKPLHPILIIDDEESILFAMDTTLQMAGLNHVITCQDSRSVMHILSERTVDLILLDLNMPHMDGETLLDAVKKEYPEIPIIIITGAIEVDTAVRCIKAGAFDYIVKPVDEERLITAVNRALSFQELKRENALLQQRVLADSLERPEFFKEIITNNQKMLSIFQYMESIGQTSQPVLIIGETGVGKELIAKTIHRISGLKGNFVAVNIAGLDDNIFSDTLFGHVKGAFTGAEKHRSGLIEKAAGGTLFLDEIGDLSPPSQVKLLRLLQEGEYLPLGQDEPVKTDARIITATNHNLLLLQATGKFRKDLIYRLCTHRIHIPPLRQRMDDLPLLVQHFIQQASQHLNKKIPSLPSELYTLLNTYSFPGNVRELKAMIFDAVSRHKGGVLSLDVFKNHIEHSRSAANGFDISSNGSTQLGSDLSEQSAIVFSGKLPTIKQATDILIEEALKRSGGNQSIAAQLLGITQQALSKRLKNRSRKDEIDHPKTQRR